MRNFLLGQCVVYLLLLGWTTYSVFVDSPDALSSLGSQIGLLLTMLVLPMFASGTAAYLWNLAVGPCRYFENPTGHPFACLRMGIITGVLVILLTSAGLILPLNEQLTLLLATVGVTVTLMALSPGLTLGQCRACGYDIRRSLQMGRCPECGLQLQ